MIIQLSIQPSMVYCACGRVIVHNSYDGMCFICFNETKRKHRMQLKDNRDVIEVYETLLRFGDTLPKAFDRAKMCARYPESIRLFKLLIARHSAPETIRSLFDHKRAIFSTYIISSLPFHGIEYTMYRVDDMLRKIEQRCDMCEKKAATLDVISFQLMDPSTTYEKMREYSTFSRYITWHGHCVQHTKESKKYRMLAYSRDILGCEYSSEALRDEVINIEEIYLRTMAHLYAKIEDSIKFSCGAFGNRGITGIVSDYLTFAG